MRVAVVSDIHGNYHALEAVLARGRLRDARRDLVPGRRRRLRARAEPLLRSWSPSTRPVPRRQPRPRGHRLALGRRLQRRRRRSPSAGRRGCSTTRPAGSWGRSPLPRRGTGAALFHGSPLDPVWDYVLSEQGARASLDRVSAPLVMVGHSHVALSISYDGATVSGGLANGGDEVDLKASRWLLNPGSVGQPRGGDPRAAWADARPRRGARLVPPHRVPARAHAG